MSELQDNDLFQRVDAYIAGLLAPHDAALEGALQAQADAEMPRINVSPNQGKLLHLLALLCRARRILEIGTLSGYSAIWMARALPPDGQLITLEHNLDYARIARTNIARAGLQDVVTVREGTALDTLPQIAAEAPQSFDMIFIDADKEPYPDYLHWALRLARPGALLVADNVIRRGRVLQGDSDDASVQGVQQFNAALAASAAVTATIVQTVGSKGYDGMALAVVNH
jgi:caffeoyl-CoA O-methyltransferase